jgi:hypothetical protein
MSELSDWVQTNWYELASLVVQSAILAALIWYGRKTWRTIRASQQQMETLLSLSLAPGTPAAAATERVEAEEGEHRVLDPLRPLRSAIRWLGAPIGSAETHPWRRVMRWLQAPAGS